MKLKYCLLVILWPIINSGAQQTPAVKPLAIGDTLPPIVFDNLLNYKHTTARLGDFKAKLIILDFWSSWCGSCIRLFPFMDSLQRQYKNDIKILLVNTRSRQSGDDKKKILGIMDKVEKRTGSAISLPVIFNADLLDKYFPLQYLPHEVWLNEKGVVLAITSSEEVTIKNINALLAGKSLSLHEKKDQPGFDPGQPLFVNGNGGDGSKFMSRSLFTGYIEGLKNNIGQSFKDNQGRLYIFNQPLITLCRMAYPAEFIYPYNRLVLDVKEPQQFLGYTDIDSIYNNLYCYDLIVPNATEQQLRGYLRHDLQRTLNISVSNGKKLMTCRILTSTEKLQKCYTKGGPSKWDLDKYSSKRYMQNQPIATVVDVLNKYFKTPLIDETNIHKNIDILLPDSLSDTTALLTSLKDCGFSIREEVREVPVTIITDKSNLYNQAKNE